MVDVFISYSRSDQAMVAMLARAVEAEGYEVWWDAELPPHQSYGEVITGKIEQAKAAIVVWSATAVKSEWVRAEADMARHHRKLVQTAIDDVMPPLPFNQIQYAEIGDWHGEADHPGWRKVKTSLAELCGRTAPEGPVPRPIPSAPPPRLEAPAPRTGATRWPLFVGLGVGVIGLAVAGGVLLDQHGNAPTAGASQPAEASSVAAPAAPEALASLAPAPAVEPTVVVREVSAPAPASSPSAAPAQTVVVATADDVPPPNPADLTFPDSSTRLLQPSEVYPLGPTTLKVARNEIFARKGMRFTTPFLQQWFGRYAWYRPRFDRVQLNPIERANIELIRQAEARYGG
jgi:hypothetical protein